MRKLCKLIILVFILNICLTSCGGFTSSSGKQNSNTDSDKAFNDADIDAVKGGTLKLFSTNPDTLNAVFTNNFYVQDFLKLVNESLVKIDKKQNTLPVLAKSWDVSPDGLTWTFHMRENVKWHDDMPFTSEDVVFTIESILNNNANSIYKRNLQNISTFTATDPKTLQIVLKTPFSFTAEMMTFPIIAKHYFVGEDVLVSQLNMKPLGTGPYKFQSYDGKSNIYLGINEVWWNKENNESNGLELPYIAQVNVKIFENGKDAINAFQTRDIDVISIGKGECNRYNGRSDLVVKKYPSKDYEYLAFNLSKPVLSDISVRQAIAYSIDKVKLINDVLYGEAIVADMPMIPGTVYDDTGSASYNRNISKAKEILSQGGWKEYGGVLYKNINGVSIPLNLEILVNDDNQVRCKLAEKISEQLKEVGINLAVKKTNWDEVYKLTTTKNYDVALMGWSITTVPEISFAFSSSEIYTGRNVAGYSSSVVDKYLNQILTENDASKKRALYAAMKDEIMKDVPYIGLFYYYNAVLLNKRVKGDINPSLWDKYNDVARWYLPIKK